MAERLRRTRIVTVILALSLSAFAPSAWAGGSSVVGVVTRGRVPMPAGAEKAFLEGAAEISEGAVGVAPGRWAIAPPKSAQRQRREAQAAAALSEGEDAFLELELDVAGQALHTASVAYLESAASLSDAGPAVRATILLAQCRLAQRQRKAADRALAKALMALPGFPGADPPPPEVRARIAHVKQRLARRLTGRLVVESVPSGQPVRVNGMELGNTPLHLSGLAATSVGVQIGAGPLRIVDVSNGEARVHQHPSAPGRDTPEVRAVLAAISVRDEARFWTSAETLERTRRRSPTCVAVIARRRAVVVRIDAAGHRIIGGHGTRTPTDTVGFRALGRFCGARAPTNMPHAEIARVVWGGTLTPAPVSGGLDTRDWAWASVGVGAAALAFSGWQGMAAFDAADAYNNAGDPADRSAAESGANRADLALIGGAALISTGVYLLLKAVSEPGGSSLGDH